jgi:hypothetical protein
MRQLMVARRGTVSHCAFDLDHTLIRPRSRLAMAIDMRIRRADTACRPARSAWSVGREPDPGAGARSRRLGVALHHERGPWSRRPSPARSLPRWWGASQRLRDRDLDQRPGAHQPLTDASISVVTRDDMRALKLIPTGGDRGAWQAGERCRPPAGSAVVVGDSWVDGVPGAKAGVSFIAYWPAGRSRPLAGDADRPPADLALLGPAFRAAQPRRELFAVRSGMGAPWPPPARRPDAAARTLDEIVGHCEHLLPAALHGDRDRRAPLDDPSKEDDRVPDGERDRRRSRRSCPRSESAR